MAMAANLAVDFILRTLMGSIEFRDAEDKDWDAVSKLIPCSTPQQCSKRWKELKLYSSTIPGMRGPTVLSSPGSQNLSKLLKSAVRHKDQKPNSYSRSFKENMNETERISTKQGSLDHENQHHVTEDGERSTLGHQEDHQNQMPSNKQTPRSDKSHMLGSLSSGSHGPNMVIHVCDESKNLKQDFMCPRDLLIMEMRYFAEYLSVEAQRWEEVDISVHCDVQIFDWLMKYVKRGLMDKSKKMDDKKPKLEANNVISILISSDFLKMDNLVTDCISYCHENMSAIVATPCNMNCINDKLVTRIAELFNHNKLEDIKDRKDKFKSKLFCKKIEELFDPDKALNASTMYKCSACKRLITVETQDKLRCVLSRMTIGQRGHVSYSHVRDTMWDVNEYIGGLREKLKSWRDVYWRLWGSVNTMYCYRCGDYFPCSELGHCRYHPGNAEFGDHTSSNLIVGVYPCCQQRVLPFDATGQLMGCAFRDHRVNRNMTSSKVVKSTSSEVENSNESQRDKGDETDTKDNVTEPDNDKKTEEKTSNPGSSATSESKGTACSSQSDDSKGVVNNPVVLEDMYSHRSTVGVPFQRLMSARLSELSVFSVEETAHVSQSCSADTERPGALPDVIDPVEKRQATETQASLPAIGRSRSRVLQRVSMRRMRLENRDDEHDAGEDEDQPESEDTEPEIRGPPKPRPPRKVTSASRKDFSTFKSYKWDPQRSSRWNQDAQREEDYKRMTELVAFLTRQRQQTPQQDKDRQKPREFIGGHFSKLDYQFRMSQQPVNSKSQAGSSQSLTSQRSRKQTVK